MSIINKMLVRTLGYALVALSLFACDQDPVKPVDETKNKQHESPAKVVYTLEKCTLPKGVALSYNTLGQIQHSASDEAKQTLIWEIKSDGTWGFAGDAVDFEVESAVDTNVYLLKIEYYSPTGEKMNYQFIQNGQDKIHQHVFSMYRDGTIVKTPEELPYVYYYADKTEGVLTGERNPLGFEGYLQFTQPIATMSIKAELLHAYQSKYLADHTTSPFYMVDRGLRSRSTMDISVALPFRERGTTTDSPEEKPISKDTPAEVVDMEATTLSGINTTKVQRIVLGLYDGHLHGMNYHYIAGPQGLDAKNLSYEQEMTIERRGTQWEITSGDIKRFLMAQANVYEDNPIGAPVYGLWVDFYDAAGNHLNGDFAANEEYQIFFIPEHIRQFSSDTPSTLSPSEVYQYYYRDSTPWNYNSQNGGRFTGDVNPVGVKGFFVFPKGDLKFMLRLELWHTPKGKRAKSKDKFAPAHTVSQHIRETGTLKLSVSVPAYVWLDNNTRGNISADTSLDEFTPIQQAIINATCKLLGIDWAKMQEEQDRLFEGERGDESSGRWF